MSDRLVLYEAVQSNGRKLDRILEFLAKMEKTMAAIDDKITQLQTDVTNLTTVVGSAETLINGIAGQVTAAVQAALAAGATPAELQALSDLSTSLQANASGLAAAVAANTPPPAPVQKTRP